MSRKKTDSQPPRLQVHWPDDILDYARRFVTIPDGQHGGEPFLPEDVPWTIKPLLAAQDHAVKILTVYKATGAGGSTIGEIVAGHRFAVKAENILYNVNTQKKIPGVSRRLIKTQVRNNPLISPYLADGQYDQKKDEAHMSYPSCFLKVQEANETSAQSDRAGCIINDELWQYPAGIYQQMVQRTTGDYPYAKIINVTSAAEDEMDDAAIAFREGSQSEYHYCCPKCHELFWPILGSESKDLYNGELVIKWDTQGSESHVLSTIHAKCPWCDAIYKDEPKIRRAILEGADYVDKNPEHSADCESYRFNALIPWFEPYAKTIRKYRRALDKAKTGQLEDLKDFQLKSMAKTWDGRSGAKDSKLSLATDYELFPHDVHPLKKLKVGESFWHAPAEWKVEGEDGEEMILPTTTYAAVDVQPVKKILWFMAVQVTEFGDTRLLYAHRIKGESVEGSLDPEMEAHDNMWADLAKLVAHFEILPYHVGVDCGTAVEIANIYERCAYAGYIGLNAEAREYSVVVEEEDPNTGELVDVKIKHPVSPWSERGNFGFDEFGEVRRCRLLMWDKNWICGFADQILHGGSNRTFHVPKNLRQIDSPWERGEKILTQLDSMVYKAASKGRFGTLEPTKRWMRRSSGIREDLRDCYEMILVLLSVEGFFNRDIKERAYAAIKQQIDAKNPQLGSGRKYQINS